ncbi:hypothetical protein [Roseateles sp. P5_E4]
MKRLEGANVLASSVALLMLALIEGLSAAWFLPYDDHFWPLVIAGYAVLGPFAVWMWSGSALRRSGKPEESPLTWRDWVGFFFLGLVLSVAFVALDNTVNHPGLSLAFTFAAIAMTMIALPGAVRAALLDALDK